MLDDRDCVELALLFLSISLGHITMGLVAAVFTYRPQGPSLRRQIGSHQGPAMEISSHEHLAFLRMMIRICNGVQGANYRLGPF